MGRSQEVSKHQNPWMGWMAWWGTQQITPACWSEEVLFRRRVHEIRVSDPWEVLDRQAKHLGWTWWLDADPEQEVVPFRHDRQVLLLEWGGLDP